MSVSGRIAKNTFFHFIATASDYVINLAVGIVLARSLGTEQYGVYALLIWFLTLALMIVNLGLGQMVIRFVAEALGRQNRDAVKGLVRLTLLLRVLAALLVSLVILLFSGYWAGVFEDVGNQTYFLLVAIALLPQALNFAFMSIFAGFQKYDYGAYLILGTNPLRAVAVISLAVLGFGIGSLLAASIVAWVIGMFIGLFLLRRLVPLRALVFSLPLESGIRRSAVKYGLAMTGVLGIQYFRAQGTVLFLGLYRPAEDVGFFTLAMRMPAVAMTLAPAVLGAVLFPAITEQFGRGDMDKLRAIYLTSARYVMILALPLGAAGIALANPIVKLLYGADYEPVVAIMQVLFFSIAFASVASPATNVILGMNQPGYILKVGVLLVLLLIGLNLWLIPSYGLMGAAIAASVPHFAAVPLYIRLASRKIKAPWPMGDTVRIFMASSIMGLAMFGIQNYLGTVLGLVVALPVGLALYFVAIFAARVVHKEDIYILAGVQSYLPVSLRRNYAALLGVASRVLRTKRV